MARTKQTARKKSSTARRPGDWHVTGKKSSRAVKTAIGPRGKKSPRKSTGGKAPRKKSARGFGRIGRIVGR